jgi:hypothetical protein
MFKAHRDHKGCKGLRVLKALRGLQVGLNNAATK